MDNIITYKEDGTPYSEAFDDVYFSVHGGLQETQHVFLQGNDLPSRWTAGGDFVVGETGFGTGLNFLATWKLWREHGCEGFLRFISTEKYPISRKQLGKALAVWPELSDYAEKLVGVFPQSEKGRATLHFEAGKVELVLLTGDAHHMLSQQSFSADAWFLDGFSPAKNPDMWSAQLCVEIGRLTAAGGTFSTYTVAGHVRQNLHQAGFSIQKTPGFGQKRHMLQGVKSK